MAVVKVAYELRVLKDYAESLGDRILKLERRVAQLEGRKEKVIPALLNVDPSRREPT